MQPSQPKENFTDSQIEEFKHAFALFDKVIFKILDKYSKFDFNLEISFN